MRGERAGLDRWIQLHFFGKAFIPNHFWFNVPGRVEKDRAEVLRHMTDVVEAAKLPPVERGAKIRQIATKRREKELGVFGTIVPAYGPVEQVFQESHAMLRAAIAGLAAERYRRDMGRWPEGLDALAAAGFLKHTPSDPYDGKALRWRRYEDRIVIYALGIDGRDHQGAVISRKIREIGDVGFRLWNAERRRQPPLVK